MKDPTPPTMTATKPWIRKRMPRSANRLNTGTSSAPARPASAAPKAKVVPYIEAVEMPDARASAGFSSVARMRRPKLVRDSKR